MMILLILDNDRKNLYQNCITNWLTIFWVDNIQLPANHKNSIKANKN